MMSGCKKNFSSPKRFLVGLIVCGLLEQCLTRQILHMCSPGTLSSNTEKESASKISPSKLLFGVHPDTPGKEMIRVQRNFKRGLDQPQLMADYIFDSIQDSSRAWLKPNYEADWNGKKLPEDLMLKYGELANSGKTSQQHFILSDVNVEHWKRIPVVPVTIREAMRTWFGENMVIDGVSSIIIFEKIEWSARRARSKQQVWWSWQEINEWTQKTSKWQSIVKVGDLLRFDERNLNFSFQPEEIGPIKVGLHNNMYEFHKITAWNTDPSKIWGTPQVREALRNTKLLSNGKKPLYDIRIEKLLGALSPETYLGKQAARMQLQQPIEGMEDLELHWLLSGLNPYHAKILGYAIGMTRRLPSIEKKDLTAPEKECINNLQKIISMQVGKGGSTTRVDGEGWYKDALGDETYTTVIHHVERLYREVMNIKDKRPPFLKFFST